MIHIRLSPFFGPFQWLVFPCPSGSSCSIDLSLHSPLKQESSGLAHSAACPLWITNPVDGASHPPLFEYWRDGFRHNKKTIVRLDISAVQKIRKVGWESLAFLTCRTTGAGRIGDSVDRTAFPFFRGRPNPVLVFRQATRISSTYDISTIPVRSIEEMPPCPHRR
jgi:hypothetical protein